MFRSSRPCPLTQASVRGTGALAPWRYANIFAILSRPKTKDEVEPIQVMLPGVAPNIHDLIQ
jgi:hypothetical protein